jgi:hypothetical protein
VPSHPALDEIAAIEEGVPFLARPSGANGACDGFGEIPLYRIWKPFGICDHG